MSAGLIPAGDVDERSIRDVKPDDLRNYDQCHFFAGIGGWLFALQLAGRAAERSLWTGSCPCQPFSVAGKKLAQADDRHLWPVWFALIKECRPSIVFGEQVAGAIAHGWLDDAANDLETEGYAVAAAVLPACSVGAPHKRDRLWFVADAQHDGSFTATRHRNDAGAFSEEQAGTHGSFQSARMDPSPAMADAAIRADRIHLARPVQRRLPEEAGANGCFTGWETEPAVGRVADGIPARVGRLRAYGNAIVPQVAAQFIEAAFDTRRYSIEDIL